MAVSIICTLIVGIFIGLAPVYVIYKVCKLKNHLLKERLDRLQKENEELREGIQDRDMVWTGICEMHSEE